MKLEIKNGDAFQLITKQASNSVDLIVTSPPYMLLKNYGDNIENHKENYCDWLLPMFNEIYRVLKPSGSFILNINDYCEKGYRSTVLHELIFRSQTETKLKFYDEYVWHKRNAIPNGNKKRFRKTTESIFHFCKDARQIKVYMDRVKYENVNAGKKTKMMRQHEVNGVKTNLFHDIVLNEKCIPDNVFRFATAGCAIEKNTIGHPAPFNKELPAFFINLLTDENDLVIDVFSGIGSTGLACKDLNRSYIGFELNKMYADFSKERLQIEKEVQIRMVKRNNKYVVEYLN